MGVLFWLNGVSDDRARAADLRTSQVIAAQEDYRNQVDIYNNERGLRRDCVEDVMGRNNTIENWHKLYDFIANLGGPRAEEFANVLRKDFDERNPPKSVEENCKNFPEPTVPPVPEILIEEGIIDVD